jgi:amino acid transporter
MSSQLNKNKLTAISLALMIFTSVYGFGNVPLAFLQMGYGSIIWYIISALVFFVPFSLMVTEFGSAFNSEKGGIYKWMERSVGSSFAMIGTLMWYMSWVIWFVSVGNRILVPISNMIFGTTVLPSTVMVSILAIAIMFIVTFVSLRGLETIKKVASIGGIAVVSLNFILIIGAFLILAKNGFHPATPLTMEAFVSTPNPTLQPASFVTFIAFLVYAIFAYAGVESVGGLVDETIEPKKNFPKGILLSAMIIGIGYSFMILCTGFFVNFEKDWIPGILDGSVNQGNITYFMMQSLGEKLATAFNLSPSAVHTWGTVFARYVGLSMFLSLTGALFTLIYSPLKQLMEGTPEKVWPGKLGKIEEGVPKNAMKAQFLIVTFMILLNMVISLINKGAADKFFLVITNMSNIASSLPYVFIVFAYIKFKKNKAIVKPFVIMKNDHFAIGISWVAALMIIMADFFTIIEPIINYLQTPTEISLGSVYSDIISMVAGPVIFSILGWWLIKNYKKVDTR